MPARPELIEPDEASIQAAMDRALAVLASVFQAIGPGQHTLSIAAIRKDSTQLSHSADLSLSTHPMRMAVLDPDGYSTLVMLLVFALEGSTVDDAALIATTSAEPRPRAYGWTVEHGWLNPMDTAALQDAVIPCPGICAVDREVLPAPTLIKPSGTDEKNTRA
ncbi:hypothetical protein [Streptomyces sp. NPDC050535]|uniref:hypothetical protein n=1 Tax=Streptomyces sp. NPDC050535 TaxID=3365626 RepID=UPI0037BD0019